MWHDSLILESSCSCYRSLLVLIHMCATWLIHWCDMTYSYVCHDSFICVTWLIHTISKRLLPSLPFGTDSYVWHHPFVPVTGLLQHLTRLVHMCDITHSCVWHDSFICVTLLIHTKIILFLLSQPPTGWRRPIGCLKLQVIFRKRATNYRALLRKMTYKDKTSNGSTPLYSTDP